MPTFADTRHPEINTITPKVFTSSLKHELEFIELLLGDPKLNALRARVPHHPAVTRYDMIERFLAGTDNAFQYPDEGDLILVAAGVWLDSMALGGEEAPSVIYRGIDDPEVKRQLRLRVSEPEQFFDQMTALTCWNLLRQAGYRPRLVEQEGMPDITLTIDGLEEWIECKRLRLGTAMGRVRRIIKNANIQIKRADPNGAGALYIFVQRPQHRVVFDDLVPADVGLVVTEIKRELGSGFSKSVAVVIVCWDDYLLLGDFPDPTCYFVRRRSLVLKHSSPRKATVFNPDPLRFGRTVALQVRWNSQVTSKTEPHKHLQIGESTVTELFRQECELPGYVRAVHAAAALRSPDTHAIFELHGCQIILAAKRVTLGNNPYILIILAATLPNKLTQIHLGFRFYTENAGVAIDKNAYDIFESFLERYGFTITVGTQTGVIIPSAVVELPLSGAGQIVNVHVKESEDPLLAYFVKIRDGMPRIAEVSWAFAISKTRYKSDFLRNRR